MKCNKCDQSAEPGRKSCEFHLAQRREYMRRYTEENRERVNAQRRSKYLDRRQNHIAGMRLRRFGLTRDDFLDMLEEQGGVCAICGNPETSRGNHGYIKNLSVDHDHETGVVRGLLCNNCNRAIGLLRDDTSILAAAIAYLDGSRVDGVMA